MHNSFVDNAVSTEKPLEAILRPDSYSLPQLDMCKDGSRRNIDVMATTLASTMKLRRIQEGQSGFVRGLGCLTKTRGV